MRVIAGNIGINKDGDKLIGDDGGDKNRGRRKENNESNNKDDYGNEERPMRVVVE
jgi:hypothetical protein